MGGAESGLGGSENRAGSGGAGSANGGVTGSAIGGAGTDPNGGAGGAFEPICDAPEQIVVTISGDAWIDAAKPKIGHGNDRTLSVGGGAAERRALIAFTLPALADGAALIKGTLTLHLESNEDAMLAPRRLGLHLLEQQFVEDQVSWTNWAKMSEWSNMGGDFGPILSRARLPAGTSEGSAVFDVTEPFRLLISSQAAPLSLIIVEVGTAPDAPAALTFTSSEGATSLPTVVLDYCPPP